MQWSQLLWASALSQKASGKHSVSDCILVEALRELRPPTEAASDCGFRRVDASLGGFNEEVRAQRRREREGFQAREILHKQPGASGNYIDMQLQTSRP